MNFSLISLLFLVGAILIGVFKKKNIGIVAIALSLILGRMAGIKDKDVIAGFDSSLFLSLVGVTFLFSVINDNKALLVAAEKVVSLVGKRKWLIPPVIYLLGFILTAIGPGAIPTLAIIPAFAIPLAYAMGYNPIMLALIGDAGIFGGRMNTITPEGILITTLLEKQGVTGAMPTIFINIFITSILLAIMIFVYYKGYKVKNVENEGEAKVVKFNRNQVISLIGLLTMVVMVVAFKVNVGLASFLIGGILLMAGVSDEGRSIKNIPWSVLILVTGVGVLMKIVITLGGIKMLSNALATVMNGYTASPVIGITAGVMSWFTSGLGVVFPTLIPTVTEIAQSVGGGVKAAELASAIVIGGTVPGMSPVSTAGALILATVFAEEGGDKAKENKMFVELFVWSAAALILVAVLAGLGVYRMF